MYTYHKELFSSTGVEHAVSAYLLNGTTEDIITAQGNVLIIYKLVQKDGKVGIFRYIGYVNV